jgi:hypothetical protein
LTNGQAYTFTIVAQNDAGDSPPSNPTNSVTPAGKPLAPPTAHATPGNHRATVTWSAANGEGSPITGYVITAMPGRIKTNPGPGATSVVVQGLQNGTSYHFNVAAKNAVGVGAARQTNAVKPAGYPGKVGNVHATARRHSAVVTWSPAKPNGAKVQSYRIVTSNGRHLVVQGSAHRVQFKHLKTGAKIRFRVRAINKVGAGAWSNWTPRVTIK